MNNEPYGWMEHYFGGDVGNQYEFHLTNPTNNSGWFPLYTAPKELSDEEIHDLMDEIRQVVGDDIERAMYRMVRATLRKAQEK